jgi:hypothetical protein
MSTITHKLLYRRPAKGYRKFDSTSDKNPVGSTTGTGTSGKTNCLEHVLLMVFHTHFVLYRIAFWFFFYRSFSLIPFTYIYHTKPVNKTCISCRSPWWTEAKHLINFSRWCPGWCFNVRETRNSTITLKVSSLVSAVPGFLLIFYHAHRDNLLHHICYKGCSSLHRWHSIVPHCDAFLSQYKACIYASWCIWAGGNFGDIVFNQVEKDPGCISSRLNHIVDYLDPQVVTL